MLKYFVLFMMIFTSGCSVLIGTDTSHKPWRGNQVYQGQGGAIEIINGVEFWSNGEPDRPYKIIGLITQSKSDGFTDDFFFGGHNRKEITDLVVKEQGDGVVEMSNKRFISGYTTQMPTHKFDHARTSADYKNSSVLAIIKYE